MDIFHICLLCILASPNDARIFPSSCQIAMLMRLNENKLDEIVVGKHKQMEKSYFPSWTFSHSHVEKNKNSSLKIFKLNESEAYIPKFVWPHSISSLDVQRHKVNVGA